MLNKLKQLLGNWKVFFVVVTFALCMRNAENEFVTDIITTLELQFDMTSSQSGALMAANSVGQLPFLIFIAYAVGGFDVPAVCGISFFIIGLMHLVIAATRFIVASHQVHPENKTTTYNQQFCNVSLPQAGSDPTHSVVTEAYVVFYIAYAIIGAASVSLNTLLPAFLEDVAPKRLFPLALGLKMGFENFGSLLGSSVASWTTSLYVTLSHTTLTPDDPSWIGAWWLGFAILGFSHLIFAFLLCIFYKQYPPLEETLMYNESVNGDDSSDEENNADQSPSTTESSDHNKRKWDWKGLPKSLWRLATTKIFVLLLLAKSIESFNDNGSGNFEFKYFVNQFNIPVWKATLMTGVSGSVGPFVSVILGGAIVSKLNLKHHRMILYCAVTILISLVISDIPSMIISCDLAPVAGINNSGSSVKNACNAKCNCSLENYTPVCDNGLTYFSACHAGCSGLTKIFNSSLLPNETIYDGCTCTESGSAINRLCNVYCPVWLAFIFFIMLDDLAGGLGDSPETTSILRSVERRDKTLAMGTISLLQALMALAAPSVVGGMIDSACDLWGETSDGSRGNCWIYNNSDYRYKVVGSDLVANVLMFLVYFLASRYARDSKKKPCLQESAEQNEREPLLS